MKLKNKASNTENLLIIFVKNPVIGKVKTRLAKSIGFENALNVYQYLVKRIQLVSKDIKVDKLVLYSDVIPNEDGFSDEIYKKGLQEGIDIGQKMNLAFENAFKDGYKNVVLIGSDIINLSEDLLITAFDLLQNNDLVFGPAHDGGYYLIGMTEKHPDLFVGIPWSTANVLKETLKKCEQENLETQHLKTLSDFDVIDDARYLKDVDFLLLEKELKGFIKKEFKKLAV